MGKSNFPPALDPADVETVVGTGYPAEHAVLCENRARKRVGDALGLNQFGVNLMTLPPGSASSQRHWHRDEDEFVYIVSGTATLVTDAGPQELGPGMMAGFPAGVPDGHHLVNNSDGPVTYLEVGTRSREDSAQYPDLDMMAVKTDGKFRFLHKDGTPYSSDS